MHKKLLYSVTAHEFSLLKSRAYERGEPQPTPEYGMRTVQLGTGRDERNDFAKMHQLR